MATALAVDTNPSRMTSPRAGGPEDEQELVARAQNGDVEAFEVLYRAYSARVYALCLRLTSDRQAATELLQDAFVRVWERLGTYRGDAALGTWLHRLTVNSFLEGERKSMRREKRVELRELGDGATAGAVGSESGSFPPPPVAVPAAGDFSRSVDERMDLEAALPRLSDGMRRVFVLHDIHGYRHDEIAGMLGVAAATVRVQLFRARRQLMELLNR
jgi:RNA polymerase sigma-70 factor (ECF subfamily)